MHAHGYLTIADDTEVTYQVSEFYTPNCERGLHYADPALGIDWPIAVEVISDKDAQWPPFAKGTA
jgi:dTDP-4-dehydrorhamnose 3,5-epimerase